MSWRTDARILAAKSYLQSLQQTSAADWLQVYDRYAQGLLDVTEALALAHPQSYPELGDGIDIRGKRGFQPQRNRHGVRCSSELIWGYECTLDAIELTADHLFPWSMGGPTAASNQLVLCHYHNLVKTSDVHVYPWELGEPTWLRSLLKTLAQRHRELDRRRQA